MLQIDYYWFKKYELERFNDMFLSYNQKEDLKR